MRAAGGGSPQSMVLPRARREAVGGRAEGNPRAEPAPRRGGKASDAGPGAEDRPLAAQAASPETPARHDLQGGRLPEPVARSARGLHLRPAPRTAFARRAA